MFYFLHCLAFMLVLLTCCLASTAGNTLTMDKYIIKHHLKNPNYPLKTAESVSVHWLYLRLKLSVVLFDGSQV